MAVEVEDQDILVYPDTLDLTAHRVDHQGILVYLDTLELLARQVDHLDILESQGIQELEV